MSWHRFMTGLGRGVFRPKGLFAFSLLLSLLFRGGSKEVVRGRRRKLKKHNGGSRCRETVSANKAPGSSLFETTGRTYKGGTECEEPVPNTPKVWRLGYVAACTARRYCPSILRQIDSASDRAIRRAQYRRGRPSQRCSRLLWPFLTAGPKSQDLNLLSQIP